MPRNILFFDVDGTLVDPRTGKISEKTQETLIRLHEKGAILCLATGRPPASLPDVTGLPFDGFLTCNGALCYAGDHIIFKHPMDPEDVQTVIRNAAALGRPVTVATRDRLSANGWDPDLSDYYDLAGVKLTVAADFEEKAREDVYQIMLGCRVPDHPAIIQGTRHTAITYSWDRAADVIPMGGGKGNSIVKMLDFFHMDASRAYAFGDGHNDMQMLRAVGHGIAMGNARDALKAIASNVCGPVWEDGIYHYCIDHGLI